MFSLQKNANSTMVANMQTNYRTPGQLLSALLEERGWSKRVLATVLDVKEYTVSKLCSDRQKFTVETCIRLEEVFGEPAESFLDLQKAYDLALARIKAIPNPQQSIRVDLFNALPIAEMIKRGWIDAENVRDIKNIEAGLCHFFSVEDINDVEVLPHAAKKTEVAEGTTSIQLAWLYRVKKIASEMIAPRYTKASGRKALAALAPLRISAEATRKVPKILAEAGIRFVIVEALPSSKVDGVCMWLNESAPVIAMSLRYDRIDNFWFVLRHELEHVLQEHGKTAISVDSDLVGCAGRQADLPKEERIANEAAANFAVPKEKMDAFIARKAPVFPERDLIGFAKTLQVHPGLVAGQLQFRMNRYNLFRDHLVKVRSLVRPSAVVDGWGDIAPTDF